MVNELCSNTSKINELSSTSFEQAELKHVKARVGSFVALGVPLGDLGLRIHVSTIGF